MNEKQENKTTEEQGGDMSFMGHLTDLRKRIVWSLVGIALGCIVSGVFIEQIMHYILLAPAADAGIKLQNFLPFGQPFLYFKVIFIVGIIIAFPFALYQLWVFIAPGLYQHERKWVSRVTFFTSICFFSGVSFAYFLMIPLMLSFTSEFSNAQIHDIIDVNKYFGFVSIMLIASGMLFELPMISFVLSKAGLLTPQFLRKYRRHGIMLMLVLGAILTPTTDPVSMLIFSSPLFILYEMSIWISQFAVKKKQAE